MGALTKERTDFLVVEASDYFDGTRVCAFMAGGNECFDSGEGAELVIDATRKDEFFVKTTELSRLGVKELKFPVDNAAIWMILAPNLI